MKARTGVAHLWVLGSEDEGMELDEERSANTAMDILDTGISKWQGHH